MPYNTIKVSWILKIMPISNTVISSTIETHMVTYALHTLCNKALILECPFHTGNCNYLRKFTTLNIMKLTHQCPQYWCNTNVLNQFHRNILLWKDTFHPNFDVRKTSLSHFNVKTSNLPLEQNIPHQPPILCMKHILSFGIHQLSLWHG